MDLFKTIKVADAFNNVINSLNAVVTVLRVLAVLFFIVQTIFLIKKEKGLA